MPRLEAWKMPRVVRWVLTKRNLENIKKECTKCSEIPLSYPAGFAYSNDFFKINNARIVLSGR